MKVFVLFYKDTFVVAYSNREDCVAFGKKHYEGQEWDCSIKEMWLVKNPFDTSPYVKPIPPYVKPIPPTPYSPKIWCGDGTGPKATFISDTSMIHKND